MVEKFVGVEVWVGGEECLDELERVFGEVIQIAKDLVKKLGLLTRRVDSPHQMPKLPLLYSSCLPMS